MSLELTEQLKNIQQVDWQEWFITGKIKRHITQRRTELLLGQVNLEQGMRVLDLGCSFGYTSSVLAKKGAEVFGIDINQSLLEVAFELSQANRVKVKFLRANAKRLPFAGGTFDIIICSELIEHVIDWQAVLKEIARVAKRGGRVVISTPNIKGLARVKTLLIKYRLLHIGGYERFLPPEEVRQGLNRNGLQVEAETRVNLAFSYLPDCLCRLSLWLEAVTRPLEKRWGGTVIFSCRKISPNSSELPRESARPDRILICPLCLGEVKKERENITCLNCSKKYPIRKGIPVMLADESESRDQE